MATTETNATKDTEAVDLAVISQIAEQRRENLKKDLARPVPDFIIATDQAEVAYTIEPVMLPFALMDFDAFQNALRDKYRLSFHRPSLPASLIGMGQGDTKIGAPQVRDLLDEDKLLSDTLEFTDGRFPVGRDDFVPIRSVTLNRETIHVVVQGNSKVADLVVKEVAEEIWTGTGSPKRWDDIRSMVQMISYGTATKVKFGMQLEEFLSPGIRSYIDQECVSGKRYASGMTSRSARDNFQPPSKTSVVWTLDDIKILFHVFNTVNGRSERAQFRFVVRSRDEEGTGIFAAVSELPFDEHVECLVQLREHLLAAAKPKK
jgi:hypothetical protein